MAEKEHPDFLKGSDVDKVTMINTIRGIMIDLFRGYPAYEYWGIIEGRFGDEKLGGTVRDKLEKDGLIEVQKRDERINYRLTSKGAEFANSLTLKNKVKDYGFIALVLASITITIELAQLLLNYFQNPIPLF